jgi:hypothetical protein
MAYTLKDDDDDDDDDAVTFVRQLRSWSAVLLFISFIKFVKQDESNVQVVNIIK